MQIDWFTVVAQIVNFLILVALLRRFLYGPIVQAMEERERKIASRLEDAAAERTKAEEEKAALRRDRRELEEQRTTLQAKAREEAEARRLELVGQAQTEVRAVEAAWRDAVRREQEAFLRDLRFRAGEGACDIARRALADLAQADLEQRVVRVFLSRLDEMKPDERAAMAASARGPGQVITIASAFDIRPDLRREVAYAVRDRFDTEAQPRFEIAPELICGIALTTPGHRIAWSIKDYLDALEEEIAATLRERAAPAPSGAEEDAAALA